jgi:hypothetical protein
VRIRVVASIFPATGKAKRGGKSGITSAKVEGDAMSEKLFTKDVTEQFVDGLGNGDWDFAISEMHAMQVMAGVKVDHENKKIYGVTGDEYKAIDFAHHETQRGLANLQLVDYLTGQQDRHEGNIYVDNKSGKVSGIDNDMSFSKSMTPKDIADMSGFDTKMMGLPAQIDADVGLRLLFMADNEYMTALLPNDKDTSSLTEDEMDVAMDRFHALQAHIDDMYMNDELIYSWNDHTYDEQKDNESSYMGRGREARED